MIRSNSDTTTASSPTPVSPFSSDYSVPSEPTSDETPDLGEFTAVLRAWNNLQPPLRVGNSALLPQAYTSSYRTTTSSDLREDRSTVWAHRPIANYLSPSDTLISESETTDRDQPRVVQIRDGDDEEAESFENDFYDDSDARDESDADEQLQVHDLSLHDAEEQQPSLGFLDSALKFIVAERERWAAQREAGANAAMLSGIEPRRKRRRKRNKTPRAQSTTRTPTVSSFSTSASVSTVTASTTFGDDLDSVDDVADALGVEADDSSSSVDQQPSFRGALRTAGLLSSAPGTPARPGRGRRRGGTGLLHSRSTPQLRFFNREADEEESSSDPAEESPRIKQLRLLGKKLEVLFPEDRQHLKKVRYQTMSPPAATGHHQRFGPGGFFDSVYTDSVSKHLVLGGFVDTRGDPPKKTRKKDERLIHVFVDHSNILIGLLNYLRRYPRQHPQYRDSSFNNSQLSTTAATSFTTPFVSGTSPHSFPSPYPKPPKHLSHSALSLILERGRPVTRRVMVTSSPLYQPMENAESLGFEVRVFARVPDTGDGMDRERNPGNGSRQSHHRRSQSSGSSFNSYSTNGINGAAGNAISPTGDSTSSQNQRRQRKRAGSMNNNYGGNSKNSNNNNSNNGLGRKKAHNRQMSDNTSAESEQNGGGSAGGLSQRFVRAAGGSIPYGNHTYSYSLPTSHTGSNSTLPLASAAAITTGAVAAQQHQQRVRYREQGVDEVLQLKLHQVIASIDGSPPPGSIIALATGDGNVGQFNEDGFLGAVRTALRRGWNVELYAWEGGLSRAWKREFGEGSEWGAARFKVIGLEQFGSELVEIYY